MSSITSSCLDALTFFFSDEVAKLPYTIAINRLKSSPLVLPAAPKNLNSPHNSGASVHSTATTKMNTKHTQKLIDLMCHTRIIDAILLASSYLSRGHGRLATIRVISSLTEFPQSLKALYEGCVVDVLVLISREAEENENAVTPGHDQDSIAVPAKPANAVRDVSSATSMSGLSTNSQHRNRDGTFIKRGEGGGGTPTDSAHSEADDDDSDVNSIRNIAMEETLIVTYSLANLCEANSVYATRMFNTGLFMIMTKLIWSDHLEVQRQALRCMSAMCPIISNEAIERAIFVKPKKNT
eukprot:gene873-1154_t